MPVTKQQTPLEGAKRQSTCRPCYLHLSAFKLRELFKSKKTLSPEEMEALDEAWFHTFGVLLVLPVCHPVEVRAPGDAILSVEQVLRMTNLSLTSLKRRVLYGSFPKLHRSSPSRIGWRACDVAAWLHELRNNSRRSKRPNHP
jgi:predicted DNA-binding transcriptional regulator AlpA